MAAIRSLYTQLYPPPAPLTEANLHTQSGKVFIVTGGNAGVGLELVKILYSKGGKVYMASRNQQKAEEAINAVRGMDVATTGEVKFLELDLNDLETVKKTAETFKGQESKLDVLWNNAGISNVLVGSKTKQGYEQHMGVNCLGPFLLTQLLLPQLRAAAKSAPKGSVRIIWTSSGIVDTNAPPGGLNLADLTTPPTSKNLNYANSKAGNWFLASQFSSILQSDGIVSITQNPGNLSTDIWENAPKAVQFIFSYINHPPKFGAYTELWAGLSNEVTVEDGGRYAIPWGRWHGRPRKDILDALKTEEEGGTGQAGKFWKWCEEQTKPYI